MRHFVLLVICFLSIQVFIQSNFFALVYSTIARINRAILIILNKGISDHWKEIVVPIYSFQAVKSSLQMLSILFSVVFLFIIADNFFVGFLAFVFSPTGIIESIFVAFICFYIRKLVIR